ncbi:ABC transporter permease [Streptomyces sp. TRM 70361]|uniref:ABC transporter permease n=1 Tax=Streptomyces sp. TRM 70361 TaxID=3116553 RepID=UPI002E7C0B61|nr:ABC transporter permease [Streptomyces sp. TRM 70361]MEE1940806.1 ABC transporter permease [Streptomyces sp. TRM 70361]
MGELLVRRAWAHRSLVVAVLFTVTLTCCALTVTAVYGDAVADAGLRRVLQDRSAARALLEAESGTVAAADDRARLDALVRDTARDAFGGLPVRVASTVRSGSYQLPSGERPAGGDPADPLLTLLATLDVSRVSFTAGARPGPAGDTGAVPVAVPEAVARVLGVRPGERMTLADRSQGPPLRVLVTGVYRPADRSDPYWRLDPLAGRGARTLGFTTYGPLLVRTSAFTGGRVAPAAAAWQARADFSAVTTARTDRLGAGVRRAVDRLEGAPGITRATSGLPALLTETERSLLASRSALLVGAAELAVLAGCVTVLLAGALNERRSGENALLTARGGTRRRLAALTAGEALLLSAPAAAVAALSAGPLAELMARHGLPAHGDMRIPGAADGRAWAVAVAVALGCAAVLTAPVLRRGGSYAGERAARIRRPVLGATVRAGADVGLLAVAAVAYTRLAGHADGGAPPGGDGTLGVDPVLVAAPAVCLLAGAVLAVRLLPVVARVGRWAAGRGRGIVLAGAHWQLSRRTGRIAGPLLLGVLAVATATLAAGQGASWDRSRQDQADYAVGADLRVTGMSTPVFGQGGVYDGLAGVSAATPVVREQVLLAGNRTATLLAMDTGRAAAVVRLRGDLADRPGERLFAPLRTADRPPAGCVLPDGARRLLVTARLRAGEGPGAGEPRERLRAVVRDRYGVPHTFLLGELPADGEPHVLEADLAAAAGPAGVPAGPLRLTRLTAGHPLPEHPVDLRLTVTGLRAGTAGGGTVAVPVPPGTGWEARARVDDPDFRSAPERGYVDVRAGNPAAVRDGALPDVRYGSGAQPPPGPYGDRFGGELTLRAVRSGVPDGPGPRPAAVATDAFLRAQGAEVGDTTVVDLSGTRLEVRITGSVRGLPTTPLYGGGGEEGALLMDLRGLQDALLARSAPGARPGEWWLAAEPGEDRRVAEALRARPDGVTLLARDEVARELATDPLAAGPRSALPAIGLAAAVLALSGVAAVTVGALRERAADTAVLRALGAPRRRIAASVAVEQGFLAVAAVGLGVLAGAALARVVVPLTAVTPRGDRPEPAVETVFPGGLPAVLAAVVVAVPAVMAAAAAVRRTNPADPLRGGDD